MYAIKILVDIPEQDVERVGNVLMSQGQQRNTLQGAIKRNYALLAGIAMRRLLGVPVTQVTVNRAMKSELPGKWSERGERIDFN